MFAYEYRYDHRGRVIEKILPGDASDGITIRCWYDRADRTAYVQDPALGSRYRFFLYDRLGRLCVQGTCIGGNQSDTVLAVTACTGGSQGICQTGYTAPYTINHPQLEIVNYYDNYAFTSNSSLTNIMPTVSINTSQIQYARGSLTGQVAYTTVGAAVGTVSVYDQKGRVVRSVRRGLGGRTEDVTTAYSFTDAVDTVRAEVGVGYGSAFTANTVYTYQKGRKTKMTVSVSHSRTAVSRQTEYAYDAIGRLIGKERQLTDKSTSSCSYSYDVHGWPTGIDNGTFQERLYYADGLDGGCWNGNISTVKWRLGGDSFYLGYNLKYDDCNRLRNAVFGTGDNLGGNLFYYNEFTDYDCNGNVTRLKRHGLTDNLHVNFGLVDNLYMTYVGNRLTSVRDSASHFTYANATDFSGVTGQEYPLTYDASGALTSDAGRGMARIDYDQGGNPVRIQFTDGSVTRYIYSAAGEKLRVTHLTAVPNITVPIGTVRELAPSEILSADSTDYLLGGTLTLRNGRIDKYQFEEGYCQAVRSTFNPSQDGFTFYYYDRDHLGSVRQVIEAEGTDQGTIVQRMNYYPSGLQFCNNVTDSDVQPRRYNGKELDKMHGLNTYDYGARQYNPVTARWDRMDPLCEKYYGVSPYAYCHGDPVNRFDPDGCKDAVFVKGKDKPISEDKSTRTPLFNRDGSPNKGAYNCHTFAWSYPNGDPTDVVDPSHPRWDNNPENNMSDYILLNNNEPNEVDDRVVYYIDNNSDGLYQKGEHIVHSAIVWKVDKEGYTTEVISKMGQDGISRNHPRAPGFYETHNGQKTNRAYFRETKKWLLQSNRRSLSLPKYHHVEKPDALYVAPIIHH